MDDIPGLVEKVILLSGGGVSEAADTLMVSRETIERWRSGSVRPRPTTEGTLRRLLDELEREDQEHQGGIELRKAVHSCLAEIREALHRRGRLSSRNEALDEVATLLFAHAVSTAEGGSGISRSSLDDTSTPAVSLRKFVNQCVESHLPKSLGHEVGVGEFSLRLKPQEDDLATDILIAFEKIIRVETSAGMSGPHGVDMLNEVFGQFLADSFIDEKELGQYLTPPEVVTFMVRLGLRSMNEDDRRNLLSVDKCLDVGYVLDPSCGVGSFLSEFLRESHRIARFSDEDYGTWLNLMSEHVLVGIDKSERMIRLALANLAIFGSPTANLHLANSLSRNSSDLNRLSDQTALILTNPPFGASFNRDELTGYKIAGEWTKRYQPTIDSELLFIERYLDWLKPNGQVLVIVPDSVLTNRGIFADLREGLRRHIELLSVISLPPVTFASAGTSTKTSILHLKKRAPSTGSKTAFAICTDIGFTVATRSAQRKKQHTNSGELPLILHEMFSPSPHSLVQFSQGVNDSLRWDATFHAATPPMLRDRLEHPQLGDVRVGDIASLSNERIDPRRSPERYFKYIEISDVNGNSGTVSSKSVACEDAPSRARQSVRAGDVLVSTVRPERRTIGVVPPWLDGSICTTGIAVLRPSRIDGFTLARLLRSPIVTSQLLRNNVGIAYPVIEPACLLDVLLPIRAESIEQLNSLALEVQMLDHQLLERRNSFFDAIKLSEPDWVGKLLGEIPDVVNAREPNAGTNVA